MAQAGWTVRQYDAAQTAACNTVRAHVVDATRLLMRALECIGSDEATDVLLTAAKSIALASSVNDQITRDDLSAFGVAHGRD